MNEFTIIKNEMKNINSEFKTFESGCNFILKAVNNTIKIFGDNVGNMRKAMQIAEISTEKRKLEEELWKELYLINDYIANDCINKKREELRAKFGVKNNIAHTSLI